MRAYVATTGVLFWLLVLAHVVRATKEPQLTGDPWFLGFSALAVAIGIWSIRLLVRKPAPS